MNVGCAESSFKNWAEESVPATASPAKEEHSGAGSVKTAAQRNSVWH